MTRFPCRVTYRPRERFFKGNPDGRPDMQSDRGEQNRPRRPQYFWEPAQREARRNSFAQAFKDL